MLFNVLFVILMLYAIFAPCIFIKFGMQIAEKDDGKAETPIFNVPTAKKKPKLTLQERREIQKFNNMMNYNGTSNGQVKISEVK